MRTKLLLSAIAAAIGLACVAPARAEASNGKVKVILMIGQSNMQGKGSMKHLEELAAAEPDKYAYALKERDDVWAFFGNLESRDKDRKGPLKVGEFTYPAGRVGPEIGFGKIIGNATDEPVVLLKICWGGQSLAVDFRPPSAGQWDKEFNTKEEAHWKPGTVGWAYKQIFNEMHHCFDNWDKNFPALAGREHEVIGAVWFQGWNDLIDGKNAAEYQSNLPAFIKDLRKDVGVPNMPFVIGIVGNDGADAKGGQLKVRQAQAAVAEMPEFKGTVVAVPTAPFWDPTSHGERGYHYNGSAKFYIQAGEAFGKAMLSLLKKQ